MMHFSYKGVAAMANCTWSIVQQKIVLALTAVNVFHLYYTGGI